MSNARMVFPLVVVTLLNAQRDVECGELTFGADVSEEARQAASFVWAGMIASREALVSGTWSAAGRLESLDKADGDLVGDLSIDCQFDHGNGRLRFDRIEPVRMTNGDGSSDEWTREVVRGELIQSPEELIEWNSINSSEVRVHDPATSPGGRSARPFDVRILGLSFLPEFEKNVQLDQVLDIVEKQEVVEAVEESPGVFRLSWLIGRGNEFKRIAWFDAGSGYSPVRLEAWRRPAGKDSTWSVLMVESDVTWSLIADTWVPLTFSIRGQIDSRKPKAYHLAFDWKQVNEDPDPDRFESRSLSGPGHARIVDLRLGKPITVGRLRDERADFKPRTEVAPEDDGQTGLIMLGNLVGLTIGLTVVVVRRRRSRR